MPRSVWLAILLASVTGCAGLPPAVGSLVPTPLLDLDRGLYESSRAVAPTHPVTGRPVFNVVSEREEIRVARANFDRLAVRARRRGYPVDPRGERLETIRRISADLVSVSHRPALPWEVHLVGSPEDGAFTWGGGTVVVLDGLFGGMIAPGDEDALAAILAHEVAHVAMLHPPTRTTWLEMVPVVSSTKDPYYQASYTAEQEAEADALAVLYMALAGYDPYAASRVWEASQRRRDAPATRERFLSDHPRDADRARATRRVAWQLEPYRIPGRRNPEWRAILAENPVFPKTWAAGYRPGGGLGRVGAAVLDTYRRHGRARDEQARRREAVREFESVRVVGAVETRTDRALALDVYNGATREVGHIAFAIHYLQGDDFLLIDECDEPVAIPPTGVGRVECAFQSVPGSDRVRPEIVDVRWH